MICVGSDLFGQAAPCGEGVKKGFHGFLPDRLHGPASVVIPAPRVEKKVMGVGMIPIYPKENPPSLGRIA